MLPSSQNERIVNKTLEDKVTKVLYLESTE